MTILKNHPIEGTVGATISVTTENFSAQSSTTLYASGGFIGSACADYPNSALRFFSDTGLAAATVWTRWYIRRIGAVNTAIIFHDVRTATQSKTSLRVEPSGAMRINSGTGALVDTSTTILADGTWYRVENRTGASTQDVWLYLGNSATPLEQWTGVAAGTGTIDTIRYGQTASADAHIQLDAGALSVDAKIGSAVTTTRNRFRKDSTGVWVPMKRQYL